MLVLARKRDESIVIAGEITITVLEIRGDLVRLGITAPRDVTVNRQEIQLLVDERAKGRLAQEMKAIEEAKDYHAANGRGTLNGEGDRG